MGANKDDAGWASGDRFQDSRMVDPEQWASGTDRNSGGPRPQPTRRFAVWPAICGVLGLVVIVMAALWMRTTPPAEGRLDAVEMERRLDRITQRLEKIESQLGGLGDISQKARKVDLFIGRFERLERTTARRLDDMENRLTGKTPLRRSSAAQSSSAAGATPPGSVEAGSVHVVQKGDTLFSIGRKYQLSVDALRSLNGLPPDAVIQPGQQLRVRGE